MTETIKGYNVHISLHYFVLKIVVFWAATTSRSISQVQQWQLVTKFKATICNFDRDPLLWKPKRCTLKCRKNSNCSKIGSYFMEKMSSGFPSDVLRLLCLSAAFYLAELSLTTTCCCSCSFSLQAVCMLLSGTSVNHRVEAEQS